jgi:hypothetical protein
VKLYCVITPSHRSLYERFFVPSLDRSVFELRAFWLQQEGKGEFLADDFKRCIRFKLAKIRESIQQNQGAIIVWSDIDIQFFGLRPDHISAYFGSETDFVAQRLNSSNSTICGGFYAIRCSSHTERFFDRIARITQDETNGNEQEALNSLLQEEPDLIRWRLFGSEFYARSHGIRIPSNTRLHHATCVVPGDSIGQKTQMLDALNHFDEWSSFKKNWYILQQLPAALHRKWSQRKVSSPQSAEFR